MRLEMVIRMQYKIIDGHHRTLFERLIWKEISTLTIQDFDPHFRRAFRVSSSRDWAVHMYLFTYVFVYICICWHMYLFHDSNTIFVFVSRLCVLSMYLCRDPGCTFLDGYRSTVQGLLDWFEVDLEFTELLFIQIDLCALYVFVSWPRVYGVATISRLLKMIGLFCKRGL